MKKTRLTKEQIVRILQEVPAGRPIRELCRRHGITETTERTARLWPGRPGALAVAVLLAAPAAHRAA